MSDTHSARCRCLRRAVGALSRSTIDEGIEEVERAFLSERDLAHSAPAAGPAVVRCASEPPNYSVDYDELCAPPPAPDHPTFKEHDDCALAPALCAWSFVGAEDLKLMRESLFDRDAIRSIVERRLPEDSVVFRGRGREIFLDLVWEVFKYMRDNLFSGKGISSILGLLYLTHRFFLSNSWRTSHETYAFFQDGLDLHAFLVHCYFKPPESEMIFDFAECDKLLEMFRSLYIQKLELIRSSSEESASFL